MWNLGNNTDEHMVREKKQEREANHRSLLMIENKLRVDGRRWVEDGLNG